MTEIRRSQPKDVQHILTQVMLDIVEKQIKEAEQRTHIRKDTNTVSNMPMTKGA